MITNSAGANLKYRFTLVPSGAGVVCHMLGARFVRACRLALLGVSLDRYKRTPEHHRPPVRDLGSFNNFRRLVHQLGDEKKQNYVNKREPSSCILSLLFCSCWCGNDRSPLCLLRRGFLQQQLFRGGTRGNSFTIEIKRFFSLRIAWNGFWQLPPPFLC